MALVVLGLLVAVVFRPWFFSGSILTQGDWGFFFKETLATLRSQYFSLWLSDFSFGRVLLDLGQAPTYGLSGALSLFLNMDWPSIERIVYFIPAVLVAACSSFLLSKRIFNSMPAAFVAAFVYLFNTYNLTLSTGHVTLMAAFAFAPLVFLLLLKLLEEESPVTPVVAGLVLFVAASYEPRGAYVLAGGLFLFFILHLLSGKRFNLKHLFLAGGIFLLLNFYWLLGLINVESVAGEGLLTRSLWGNQYYDIQSAITAFHPWWTGTKVAVFQKQVVPLHAYLVPLFAFAGLYVKRKNRLVLMFGAIALVGILLSKQVGVPFAGLYQWLFDNFPGFKAFREASKFYVLITLGFSVLISGLVSWLFDDLKNKHVGTVSKVGITSIIAALFLLNAIPVMTGGIGSLFVGREIPSDYSIFRDRILSEKGYSRILWVPTDSRWAVYTSDHSKLSLVTLIGNLWSMFARKEFSISTPQYQILDPLNKSFSDLLLNSSSVKYVVVPIQDTINGDDFFLHYGGREKPDVRSWYISQLDALPYLKRVDWGLQELTVYENSNYHEHVSALDSLIAIDSENSLDQKYRFIRDNLNSDAGFYFSDGTPIPSSMGLWSIYDTIQPSDINDSVLSYKIDAGKSGLYENRAVSDIYYVPTKNGYLFERKSLDEMRINQQLQPSTSNARKIHESPSGPLPSYIDLGSRLVKLDPRSETNLGRFDGAVRAFTVSEEELIANGGFEQGLWQEKVGDCNAYDDKGIMAQALSNDAAVGKSSLELEATRHIACTAVSDVKVGAGRQYVLSFRYKGVNATQAGYYIRMTGNNVVDATGKLPVLGDDWQTFNTLVSVPDGISRLSLTLYSYAKDEVTPVKVRYDAVSLVEATEIAAFDSKQPESFGTVPVSGSGTYLFQLTDKTRDSSNLIPNPDFSKGLWQEKVGDCNFYDRKGKVGMSLVDDARDHGKALELEAVRHTACTGPVPIPVKEGSDYLLAFDYQSSNAIDAGYYISFFGSQVTFNERLPIKGDSWKTFSKRISVPSGATGMNLVVYSYEKDQVIPVRVRYDNFYFSQIPSVDNRYYVASTPETAMKGPTTIGYEISGQGERLVHIKGATTPFYLSMSESYHPQWRLAFNDRRVGGWLSSWTPVANPHAVPDEHHFELNGFLNGWYLDTDAYCNRAALCTKNADGSYDMEMVIEFVPQRWFYVGLLVSGTTLLACLGYLGWVGVRRIRRWKPKGGGESPLTPLMLRKGGGKDLPPPALPVVGGEKNLGASLLRDVRERSVKRNHRK